MILRSPQDYLRNGDLEIMITLLILEITCDLKDQDHAHLCISLHVYNYFLLTLEVALTIALCQEGNMRNYV